VSQTPGLTPTQLRLRQMVLDSVTSPHSRRNYGKALDLLFAFAASRPLTRALLLEYRTSMEDLAPSTVNVRLAAVRKLVSEARKNGMLSHEEAGNLTDIPNVKEKGTRLGNWLTKEQARELLAVPDRSTVKGKRDYAILALLVGCALRRRNCLAHCGGYPDAGEPLGHHRSPRQGRPSPDRADSSMGEEGDRRLAGNRTHR
jgi:site-specific recombinase XerD